MTTELNENLSDLMDSELDAAQIDQVLAKLQKDPEAKKTWSRFHLMRDVMQNDYSPVLDSNFADKVARAIESEPAIVAAPAKKSSHLSDSESSNVVVKPAFNWKRNLTGLAVAASVAMVSIIGLNTLRDNQAGSTKDAMVASGPSIQSSVGAGQLDLVSNRGTYWKSTGENTLTKQGEQRLNMFLSQHIENAPTAFSGMVPYSRLVGYDEARGDAE